MNNEIIVVATDTHEYVTGSHYGPLGKVHYLRVRSKANPMRYPHGIYNQAGSRSYIQKKAEALAERMAR